MTEPADHRKVFTLLQVSQSIQRTIYDRYKSAFWVKTEINKLNYYPHSGHCYPELVEKKDGKVVTQMKAIIWKNDYLRIQANFQKTLNEPLKNGIQVLAYVRISFDPQHGLSLLITDIDPGYTLGVLEQEKADTIFRLKQEGLFEQNKTCYFPLLPQRIAIISVETSKGYADFRKIIDTNPYGYKFFYYIFPALLQGERAVDSILQQLKRIRKVIHHFDVVAIVRGGGGDVGLSCYNNYALAKEIALFPLPVITGIGHATNETVVEMLAFKNAITPTESAGFLLQSFQHYSASVKKAEEKISGCSSQIVNRHKERLTLLIRQFSSQSGMLLYKRNNETSLLSGMLKKQALLTLKDQSFVLTNLEKQIELSSPERIMKRGFSISLVNGKPVYSCEELKEGDILDTILPDGNILSKIITINKNELL